MAQGNDFDKSQKAAKLAAKAAAKKATEKIRKQVKAKIRQMIIKILPTVGWGLLIILGAFAMVGAVITLMNAFNGMFHEKHPERGEHEKSNDDLI